MGHVSKYATAFCIAALLIVGGGAYALASSTGTTITVCVSHHDGTLYKASKCAKHDKKLTWDKQGPQGAIGPQGQQGVQGQQGIQGQAGTARAYAEVTAGGVNKTPAFKSGKVSGFTAVTNPQVGVYCLTSAAGIDPATSAAVVSALYNSGFAGVPYWAYRSEESGGNPCPSSQFTVNTFTASGFTDAIDFSIVVA